MLTLPPLPGTVLVPTEDEMRFGSRHSSFPRGSWREEDCQTCQGTKSFRMWSGVPLASDVVEYECPCADQVLLHRWLGVRGVPHRFRLRGFSDLAWVSPEVLTVSLSEWSDPAKKVRYCQGVVIRGPKFSGKSLLMSLLQRQVLAAGIDARCIGLGFFTSIVDDWKDPALRHWYSTAIRSAPVLCVTGFDDTVALPEWALHRIDELFAFRLANGLTSIVETSGTPEGLTRVARSLDSVGDIFDVVQVTSMGYPSQEITRVEMELGISRPAVMR